MKLNYDTFMKMSNAPKIKTVDAVEQIKLPGLKAVTKVTNVFNGPMTAKDIEIQTGLSQSTTHLIIRFLRTYGDLTTNGLIHTPTSDSKLLKLLQAKPHRSNTGVTGVSFNTKTKVFTCSFQRGYTPTFKTLLDAVCHRRSLELGVIQC